MNTTDRPHTIQLNTALDRDAVVVLSQKFAQGDGINVDTENGLLGNVAFITEGEAIGHPFFVDAEMVRQVVEAVNGDALIKSRFTHPEWGKDTMLTLVGEATNARIAGKQVRGDIDFLSSASNLPGLGDVQGHLFSIASEKPEMVGLSIHFTPDWPEMDRIAQETGGLPPGRLRNLIAVDFVGDPGANPNGLLSRPDAPAAAGAASRKERAMNEKLRTFLIGLGLAADATDVEANAYLAGLEGEQAEQAESLKAEKAPVKPAAEPEPADAPTGLSAGDAPTGLTAGAVQAIADRAAVTALKVKTERDAALRKLGTSLGIETSYVTGLVDDPEMTLELAQKRILGHLAETHQAVELAAPDTARIAVGEDLNLSTLHVGMRDALLLRAGANFYKFDDITGRVIVGADGQLEAGQPHERARSFRRMRLSDMARAYMLNAHIPGVELMGQTEITEYAMNRRKFEQRFGLTALAQATGDFPYILADAMNKSLRAAYVESPSTWQIWARRRTVPDFKTIKFLTLSESANLTETPEGGEIQYGTLSESRETVALVTYSDGLRFTRAMLINDDLDAFSRAPQLQAAAAKRKEDDVAYAVITANAAMSDGITLFDATTHVNHVDTGAAPATAGLNTAKAMMRGQKGLKGDAYLNIVPKFILIPEDLEGTVAALLQSQFMPEATYGHGKNIWQGALTPVVEPRLGANSTTAWYLAADSRQIDTVVMIFLDDEPNPVGTQETQFDTGDLKLAIRHNVAAAAVDYRGLFKNDGT